MRPLLLKKRLQASSRNVTTLFKNKKVMQTYSKFEIRAFVFCLPNVIIRLGADWLSASRAFNWVELDWLISLDQLGPQARVADLLRIAKTTVHRLLLTKLRRSLTNAVEFVKVFKCLVAFSLNNSGAGS